MFAIKLHMATLAYVIDYYCTVLYITMGSGERHVRIKFDKKFFNSFLKYHIMKVHSSAKNP